MKIEKNIGSLELCGSAYLRPLRESDVTNLYVDGLNDPGVNQFLVGPRSQHQTFELVNEFVRMNWESPTDILFGLFVDDVLSGTLRLHDITVSEAYLGLALFDRNVWGQGWGRKMIAAVSQWAFTNLGVRKVKAGIAVDNVASQKAFRAAGFQVVHSEYNDLYGMDVQSWELRARIDGA